MLSQEGSLLQIIQLEKHSWPRASSCHTCRSTHHACWGCTFAGLIPASAWAHWYAPGRSRARPFLPIAGLLSTGSFAHKGPVSPNKTFSEPCACVFSRIQLFVTPWTVAHQVSLSIEFSRKELLERVATLFSRGSSQPRDQPLSPVSSIFGRQILYHCATWEAPRDLMQSNKYLKKNKHPSISCLFSKPLP